LKITLKLVGHLKNYTGTEALEVELPAGADIQTLLQHFKIQPGEVMAASINGIRVDKDTVLHDNDLLLLIPLAGGG
jgi:molybdopterin converting factor small subunit